MGAPTQNSSDPPSSLMTDFLAELAHANRSRHTCRAYATEKNGRGGPLRYQSVQERWTG